MEVLVASQAYFLLRKKQFYDTPRGVTMNSYNVRWRVCKRKFQIFYYTQFPSIIYK